MRHQRAIISSAAVGLTSFFAVGAGAAANAMSAHLPTPHASTTTSAMPASQRTVQKPTVRTLTTDVNGKSESILVDAQGLPLYYHRGDTAKKSLVSGTLAQLWPPLVSPKPTGTGTHGKLTTLKTANGQEVAYNGRFLYAFVDDTPRHVTGQGVSNFFVATPNLKAISSAPTVAPVTSSGNNSYGY
jgi:predicted lipoprotein with Yx(FWY)xxD motif